MSDKITPADLFSGIVADPRFEKMPVEDRLSMIDLVSDENVKDDDDWDTMAEWTKGRATARAIARTGLDNYIGFLQDSNKGQMNPLLRDEDFMGDMMEAAAKTAYQSHQFGGEQGQPFTKPGTGQLELAKGDDPIDLRILPHPTRTIAEIMTPEGPRRLEFAKIEDLPKTGDEWGRMIVNEFPSEFGVDDETGAPLASSFAKGATQIVANAPFSIKNSFADAAQEHWMLNHTVDEWGTTTKMDPDARESLDKWGSARASTLRTEAYQQALQQGFEPTFQDTRESRDADARREAAKLHLQALSKQKVKIFGEKGAEGKFRADERFGNLERNKDGVRVPHLKEGQEIPLSDIFIANAKAERQEYLGDSYKDYLGATEALEETYGRNNAEALKALREGYVQKAMNVAEDVSNVVGQLTNVAPAAMAGPAGLAALGYGSAYAGHYGETYQGIYQDAEKHGASPGEALDLAHKGASRAAELAAPIDATGDMLLGGAFKGLGGLLERLPMRSKDALAKRIAVEMSRQAGVKSAGATAREVFEANIAQMVSETAGELTRSEIEDMYQVDKDGHGKNFEQAMKEGLLALFASGATSTASQFAGFAGDALEANRRANLVNLAERYNVDLENLRGASPQEREAAIRGLWERQKVKGRGRHDDNSIYNNGMAQVAKNGSPLTRTIPQEEAPAPVNLYNEPGDNSDESQVNAFKALGKSPGDVVETANGPVRLLEGSPEGDTMSFKGAMPDGSVINLSEQEVAGSKLLSTRQGELAEQASEADSQLTFNLEPEPEAPPAAAPNPEAEPEEATAIVPDEEGDFTVGPAKDMSAEATDLPAGPLNFRAATGLDLTQNTRSTLYLRGYRGAPVESEVGTVAAPKPEEESEGKGTASVVPGPAPIRSKEKSEKFWGKVLGPAPSVSIMAPRGTGVPGAPLVMGRNTGGPSNSVLTVARMMGSESLLLPGMEQVPVMLRPLSSMKTPGGVTGIDFGGTTRAVYAHAFLKDSSGQIIEAEAMVLDSNTFNKLSPSEQKTFFDHEVRHMHTRRMLNAAALPGASPELVEYKRDFDSLGKDFINAYEANPEAWAGIPDSLRQVAEAGDATATADELISYALTEPAIAKAMQKFGPDFLPLKDSKAKEGGPKTLWQRIIDLFKRAFQLGGLGRNKAAAEAAVLDPDTALNRIQAHAKSVSAIAGGRKFASKEAAEAKAQKLGFRDYEITQEGDTYTLGYKGPGTKAEDVFSGANLTLGAATQDVVAPLVEWVNARPDTTVDVLFGGQSTVASRILYPSKGMNGYAAALSKDAVQLWNQGLRNFTVWSKAVKEIYPHADTAGLWDVMQEKIGKQLASGGPSNVLALKFQGDIDALRSYQQELYFNGRAEKTVNSIVETAKVPYKNGAGDTWVFPNTALLRFGPEAPPMQRYIQFGREGTGRGIISLTPRHAEAVESAKKRGQTDRLQELQDIALSVKQYAERQAAVRAAKRKLGQVVQDRMGTLMIPGNISAPLWEDIKRKGFDARRVNSIAKTYSPDPSAETLKKLAEDIQWYLKKHREIDRQGPEAILGTPKLKAAAKAAKGEAWSEGKAAGREVAKNLFHREGRLPSNEAAIAFARLAGWQDIPVTPSMGFTRAQIEEVAENGIHWSWRQGLLAGMRTEATRYMVDAREIDGSPVGDMLNMLLGVEGPEGDFFEVTVVPALREAYRGAKGFSGFSREGAASAIDNLRKEWKQGVEKARERAGYKSKGTVKAEFLEEFRKQAFDELVAFNRETFDFAFQEWEQKTGDNAVGLLTNLRRAFGTDWIRPTEGDLSIDRRDASGNTNDFSHEWISRKQATEEKELKRLMARSLMFLAHYDKGKALDLAVALSTQDGGTDDASMSRKIEELLLEKAAPSLAAQATRIKADKLVPSLMQQLGASEKDIHLMLSLGGAAVVSMRDILAVSGDVNSPAQQLANIEIQKWGDESPVLVMDSSRLGESLGQRLNLGTLVEQGRNIAGIRFTTVPAMESPPGGSWGGSFNIVDASATGDRPGRLTGILGAQGLLSVEQSGTDWFKTQANNSLRGMAELSQALSDAYPMLQKLAQGTGPRASVYGRAAEALDALQRTHGPLGSIPAGTLAMETLVNPGFRQALLAVPDIFDNNRTAKTRGVAKTARKIVESDRSEAMADWFETSAVVDSGGNIEGLTGDYDPRDVIGGRSRFKGDEVAEEFASAFDDAMAEWDTAEPVFDQSPASKALEELGDLIQSREIDALPGEIEGLLDTAFAERQVAMALEILRVGAQARARSSESSYGYAEPRQEGRVVEKVRTLTESDKAWIEAKDIPETDENPVEGGLFSGMQVSPVPMPSSDVADALGTNPALSMQEEVAKALEAHPSVLAPRSMDRISRAMEKHFQESPPQQEATEFTPLGAVNLRAATAGSVMAGTNTKIADPVARKAEAALQARDYIKSVMDKGVLNQILGRPMSREFFSEGPTQWVADLIEFMMEPRVSPATTDFYRTKIHNGFAPNTQDGIAKRAGDYHWEELFDAWRKQKGPRVAMEFLLGTRGKIKAVNYEKRFGVLKSLAHNDAIYRKLGSKSPETLDWIMNLVTLMEYGTNGKKGFTGFRSATMGLEKTFDKFNQAMGPHAERYVMPTLVGHLMQYGKSPQISVGKMITSLQQAEINLGKQGFGITWGAYREKGLYREAMAELIPLAEQFRDGLINRVDYEMQLKARLDSTQKKWLDDVTGWFDEIRPAMEITAVVTGQKQGVFENYFPMMNARMDGATSTEDFNYRPAGEKVGTSRTRMSSARWNVEKDENYIMNLNGAKVIGKARAALFSLKTFESGMLMHDILGTVNGGKPVFGYLDQMMNGDLSDDVAIKAVAGKIGASLQERSDMAMFTSAMRMVFDRERTGFQSGLHMDNMLRRAIIRSQQLGAYYSLADVEQIYRQTLPAMTVYGARLARDPQLLAAQAKMLAGLVRKPTRTLAFEAMKRMAPSVWQRGLDGQEAMSRKIALGLLRKPEGLDIGVRGRNAGTRGVHMAFEGARLFLDWTTGKPDGAVSKMIWFAEVQRLQNARGFNGDDVWLKLDGKTALKAQTRMEELMGQSEITRRGNLLQDKGSSIGQEFLRSVVRAFGSYNISMAATADALWSEIWHAPKAKQKATAALKLAEIPAQNILFRLLSKPFRDLAISYMAQGIYGMDDRERKKFYRKWLEQDLNARKTRGLEDFDDAWARYGWRMMAESTMSMTGGQAGSVFYWTALPILQDWEVAAVGSVGESIKSKVTGKPPHDLRDFSAMDITEKSLGYSGSVLGRGADLFNRTMDMSNSKKKVEPGDYLKIALIAAATRGVAARANDELMQKFKPGKGGRKVRPGK